jgi:Ca-activated chloride channel family protein
MLKESDVAIYSVGIEESGYGPLSMEGSGILDEISGVSGGKAFFPRSSAEMDDIFEQIALELRHQYSIGYRPPDFVNDGKWHKIKVKVTPRADCRACLYAASKATSQMQIQSKGRLRIF